MPQLAIRTRSGKVESIHDGYICITDSDNKIINQIGNPEARIFPRSSGKPILAVAFVNSGAMKKYNISMKELAIICSSHSGQAFHRRIIKNILKKLGLSEKDLDCGHAYPVDEKVKKALIMLCKRPDPIFSSCSGKHAGMLALCRYYDFPIKGYTESYHPVQRLIKKTVADILGMDQTDLITGRDGCSVLTYNLTFHQISWLYGLLAHGYEGPGKYKECFGLIQTAMKTYPRIINGDGQFCTDLSIHSKGRAIGKMGAEGIYCVAIPEKRLGICLKMSDGHPWASYPVIVHALKELGILDDEAVRRLEKWARPPVKDDKGNIVGYIYPTFSLSSNSGSNFEPGDVYPVKE